MPRPRVRVRVWREQAIAERDTSAEISPAAPEVIESEIESAALTVAGVFEAAAVPVYDEAPRRSVELYVVLEQGDADEIMRAIERATSRIGRPKYVWIVSELPKTRSGTLARGVLAGVSNFVDIDDTRLAGAEIVEDIRRQVQTAKLERGETPTELTREQIEEIKALGRSD